MGTHPERYQRRPTIITTLEYEEWHNFLGNKPSSLLSRLRHRPKLKPTLQKYPTHGTISKCG